MKILRNLITLSLLLGLMTLNSCKKDKKTSTVNSGSITATIDGNVTKFSNAVVLTGSTGGNNFTAIEGNASDGSTMSITIYGTLTAGTTYTSNDPDPSGAPILLYVSGSNNYMNAIDNPSVSIKITAISSSSIQGTFSGTVTETSSGAAKVITNGQFDVQR